MSKEYCGELLVMVQMSAKRKTMKIVETIFDLSYLLTVLISALLLYITADTGSLRWQFAIMALTLGIGDAFHLIPRICSMADKKGRNYTAVLGVGKLIASITMTVFYIFLWEIGKDHYIFNTNTYISIIVYGCALLRIILCILPHNRWSSANTPLIWGIIRNIPFFILGMTVMIFYLIAAVNTGGSLSFVWLSIMISFACHMPVVLFSKSHPKVGMLMLPKSCAYAAIVLMGFSLV